MFPGSKDPLERAVLPKSRYGCEKARSAARVRHFPSSGSEAALDRRFGALVAGGVSVHFLQKLAHCIELRANAFPISGLQSLHGLIVAIKRLPCLTRRWACDGHLLCRA